MISNTGVQASKRYIKDVIHVPLRSGASSQHRVIHRGLKSGTPVTLIEEDTNAGFSYVKTAEGDEGWLPSQYLITDRTAQIKLNEVREENSRIKEETKNDKAELERIKEENRSLRNSLAETKTSLVSVTADYDSLVQRSSQVIKLEKDYEALLKKNEKVDALVVENERLKDKLRNGDFINGAAVLFFGMLLTLIFQYFFKSRRRSEWR